MAKRIRNIFLFLCLLSTCALFFLLIYGSFVGKIFAEINLALGGEPSAVESPAGLNFIVIGSAITSVTSLIGFISATIIAWRKEQRESALADVERKKLELELEKSKLELEELKKAKKK